MTIDCLLLHPMVAALDCAPGADLAAAAWSSHTQVPGAEQYRYERKPRSARRPGCPLSEPDLWMLASRWLERRGVRVHCTNVGLLQRQAHRLWVADIAGERAGRLVIAATYYSRRRKGRAREHMRAYAAELGEVCRRHYRIPGGVTALVNVYGDGRAEGEFLPDPEGGPARPRLARRLAPALPAGRGRRGRGRVDGDVQERLEEAAVRGVLARERDVPGAQDDPEALVEQGDRVAVGEAREVQRGHAEAQEGLGADPGAPAGLAGQVRGDRGLDAAQVLGRGGGQAGQLGPLDAERGVHAEP
jgi:hypothetical protein